MRMKTFVLALAALLPVVVSFGILYHEALPVPYQDDYKAILSFASDFEGLPTLEDKLVDVASKQYNEYKLGFEHSIVASELGLTHHLNFSFLTVLGDLFLLPIGYLLWQTYKRDEADLDSRLLEFLPISLFFFSLTYWETMNWAMAELQNLPVVCFSFFAIYFIGGDKEPRHGLNRTLLACVFAGLAAFSSANGFLLGPLGLFLLVSHRAYTKAVFWSASFVVPLAAYVYHYVPVTHVANNAVFVRRSLTFLGFLGCSVPQKWVSALLGIAILAVICVAIRSRLDRTNPVIFYFVAWIVATGMLVAWVRGSAGFFIASRYSIYSVLLLTFCYWFMAGRLRNSAPMFYQRFLAISIVVAGVFFFTASVSAARNLGARRRMVLSGIELYRASPDINSPMVDPLVEKLLPLEKAEEKAILGQAIRNGIYALPEKP
jgi:hypothetical protein